MRKTVKIILVSILIISIIWVLFHFLYAKDKTDRPLSHSDKLDSTYQKEHNSANKHDERVSADSNNNSPIPSEELLPVCTLKGQLVKHKAYELYYVNQAEEAAWVAYNLTEEHLNGSYQRSNHFEIDPLVKDGSADNADYAQSGFDRGHLAPAADMAWSQTTMQESFYYSNMTPQDPSFNRGKWKELEEQVRNWAALYHQVSVFTGPVLLNTTQSIGHDHIIVPRYFYKIIYSRVNGQRQAIAFLMPNTSLHTPLLNYVTSIDHIEQISGINFFEALPDSIENKIETDVNLQQWDFVTKENNLKEHHTSSNKSEGTSTICKGITKAGKNCKNLTKNTNGFCRHHQAQAN